MAPEAARGWIKTYDSKLECLNELRCIDLLTPSDADEVLAGYFDVRDTILIVRTETDPETLNDAGFTENKLSKVN